MGGFNIDPLLKREQWKEGLEVAVRCMTEEPFTGVDGQWVQMPPRNVVPKPAQRPHPPLWVAASRHETILLAAENGLGALTFAFVDPELAHEWVEAHEKRLQRCKPIGELVNTDIACVTPMMVHRDETEAIRRGLEGGNFFGYSLAFYAAFGDHIPGTTDLWADFQQRRAEKGYDPEAAIAQQQEQLAAKVKDGDSSALRGAVGTEILPEFKERDEKQRAAKAARLEPVVTAALERKERNAPPMPEGYNVPAVAKEFFRAAGGDALLERVATESALGSGGMRDQMPRERPPEE